MALPWEDRCKVGELLGIKVVFNEFISYQSRRIEKKEVARLSLKALVSGTIVSFMTAVMAGVLI